jgi:hypothetical protein
MSAAHLAACLSRLAGFGATAAGRLGPEAAQMVHSSASRCCELLRGCAGALDPLRLAQATLSLARLKCYDQVCGPLSGGSLRSL